MLRRATPAPRPPPRPLTVGAGDAHMRLDRFIRSQLPALPQSLIQRLTRRRAISVTEPGAQPRKATTSERLVAGMVVHVPADIEQQLLKPTRRAADMRMMRKAVLYEDKDIIALNKPSGIPVQGGTKSQEKNIDRLLSVLRKSEEEEIPRLLHRLDKDTSGLLLVARSRLAAAKYSALFAQKASKGVEKCYLAVVSGVPKVASGRIKGGLKKEWRDGVEKVVNLPTAGEEGSKLGITEYEVLDDAEKLRVHCAEVLKCPVLGDKKYAPTKEISDNIRHFVGGQKLHLHAYAMRIPHPTNPKEKLTLTAPLPEHMVSSLKSFGMTAKPNITWVDTDKILKAEDRKASYIVRMDKRYDEFKAKEKKVLAKRREKRKELKEKQKTKRALRDKRLGYRPKAKDENK